ncbi:MAG: precorrin-8X methylmutase [Anaerolineae bacterium]|nr:precorrin-8X methylmutase [Anaerolineae bacterium]
MKPEEIEKESFRIILEELGPQTFSAAELAIVQRVIHATADFEYARLLQFSAEAITAGLNALRGGCPVICDVQMIAAGVNRQRLAAWGCQVYCAVNDPQVTDLAGLNGQTRSEVAMRLFGEKLNGALVAIGNAPTALLEVLRLNRAARILPALVVGVPVGFVNAAESKQALSRTELNFIVSTGRKGGSTVAVAILNALLRLAEQGH